MKFWETFWQFVLVIGVIGFAGLAIVVAIGGLSDIRAMLRHIASRHESLEEGTKSSTDHGNDA